MARSGINKSLVLKARNVIVGRGENPSIDRVRIELGNTGSKATIHRYLKEIEAEEVAPLDKKSLLSHQIEELVSTLAAKLYEESSQIVIDNEAGHVKKVGELTTKIKALEAENNSLNAEINTKEASLTEKCQTIVNQNKMIQDMNMTITSVEQELAGSKQVLAEKSEHIDSIENKHKHFRESLEHYRESVKNQREEDMRKHDERIQQLQMENRHSTQSISIKQTEITELNRDNARLASELSSLEKELRESKKVNLSIQNKQEETYQQVKEKHIEVSDLKSITEQLESAFANAEKEKKLISDNFDKFKKQNANLELTILKIQAQLDAKTELLDHFLGSS